MSWKGIDVMGPMRNGVRVAVDIYGKDANRVVCLKGGDHSHNDSISIVGPIDRVRNGLESQ
jgi:hypothetical protein